MVKNKGLLKSKCTKLVRNERLVLYRKQEELKNKQKTIRGKHVEQEAAPKEKSEGRFKVLAMERLQQKEELAVLYEEKKLFSRENLQN